MCVLFASPPGVVQNQVFAAASPPAGQRYRSPTHALTLYSKSRDSLLLTAHEIYFLMTGEKLL